MSENDVYVGYGDDASETATLLLAAAEKTHEDQTIVRTVEGGFMVPKDVADEAGVEYDSDEDEVSESETSDEKSADGKTAAKKTAAAKK